MNVENALRKTISLVIVFITLTTCIPLRVSAAPQGLSQQAATAFLPFVTSAPPVQRHLLFAYYYTWFDPTSWDTGKLDLPLLGKYSSDDETVLRQHVLWAKSAGIDGFIVGWRSTTTGNRRLGKLLAIADQENFKILMIYQSLDAARNPFPITTINADFDTFISTFANHPSLRVFAKPMMIWSGIWMYSAQDVDNATKTRRNSLLILGTARDVADYERVAASLDGNAYYWSSVDPLTQGGYQDKLNAMSDAVHQHHGLWIAPAAPGFDARLIGGSKVVPRNDGQTLILEMNAARQSSPDAIGLISWNEFSENTYVEPSVNYGTRYLDVLKSITP